MLNSFKMLFIGRSNSNQQMSAKHLLIWQVLQLIALICFCVQLGRVDLKLRKVLVSDQDATVATLVFDYLNGLQWPFLPNGFWFLVWPLMLAAIGLLVFNKLRWWFLSLAGFLSILMAVGDRIYLIFFDSVIPLASFSAVGQLDDVAVSIVSSLSLGDFWWGLSFCWVPIFAWVAYKNVPMSLKKNPQLFVVDRLLGIVFLALSFQAASQAFFLQGKHVVVENQYGMKLKVFADRSQAKGVNFAVPYKSSYRSFAAIFGLYNFHLYNFYEHFSESTNREPLDSEELQGLVEFFETRKSLNDTTSPLVGVAKQRNIVLISMESFATALVDLKIKDKEVTPNLNRLAREQLYWPTILDNARAGGTSDAEFSVLTGLLPDLRRMAAMGIAERNQLLGLPSSLKQEGYQTFSFHGNEASFWNRNVNHPKLGIESLHFEAVMPKEDSIGWGVADHLVFPYALDVLAGSEKPFFGFIISLTSHHPFPDISDEYHQLDVSEIPDGEFRRYLKLANYTDRVLGEFIERAKTLGLWNNMMLVLYGDHRPPLPDHQLKLFEKTSGILLDKGRGLQIPVLVALPGQEAHFGEQQNIALETVGGLQDIYPTILHLAGIDIPFGLYGTHLLVPNSKRAPTPLLKLPHSYVYNGVVYAGENGNPVADNLGLLFVKHRETLLQDRSQKKKNFQEAFQALKVHLDVFNRDAQRQAIKSKTGN